MTGFPEPTTPVASRADVLLGYLDWFRARIASRVLSLPATAIRTSVVPSGWTPLELVVHLAAVERRWVVWRFLGAPVEDPWDDERDGRWHAPAELTAAAALDDLRAGGELTSRVVATHELDEPGAPGPSWAGAPPATLERVLLHLVQEFGRHLGQLDVVTELSGGETGE